MGATLFDRDGDWSEAAYQPDARATDPETSRQAAASVNGQRDRDRAFRALAERGPMTDFELGEAIGRQQTSAGKRRHELVALELVEWTGEHRPAPSGSPARVWGLTAAGLDRAAAR